MVEQPFSVAQKVLQALFGGLAPAWRISRAEGGLAAGGRKRVGGQALGAGNVLHEDVGGHEVVAKGLAAGIVAPEHAEGNLDAFDGWCSGPLHADGEVVIDFDRAAPMARRQSAR